jgi:hypothetical protein
LAQIGLEPERIRMFHMSSAMGGAFAEAAEEMTECIAELGPSPLRAEASGNGSRIGQKETAVEDPDTSTTLSTTGNGS